VRKSVKKTLARPGSQSIWSRRIQMRVQLPFMMELKK
jgi:hypothetical protein